MDKKYSVLRIIELAVVIVILIVLLLPNLKDTLNQNDCANKDINPKQAQYWREALWKYRDDDSVHQMLLIKYVGGCDANAEYYIKSNHNNAWELKFNSDVYVGKNGISTKPVEGDNRTPTGDFGIRDFAFGILPNPGTKLRYLDVTPTTYACDEDTEYYNQIFDISQSNHKDCKGEEMYKYTPEYNYGLTLEHNPKNIYPNQSNIFIHCKGTKPFTGGCIALDQDDMKTILKTCDKGMRIVINEKY